MLKRSKKNPILLPDEKNAWEAEAVFNGCVIKRGDAFHLVYRAMSSEKLHHGIKINLSTIGHAESEDAIHFRNCRQLIKPEYDWEAFGCEDPRVTKLDGKYYIFYTALSTYPFSPAGIKLGVAITNDFKSIEKKYPVTPFNSKAMALFPERISGKIVCILTVDTDMPPAKIALAFLDEESQIWSREYWQDWHDSLNTHVIPLLRAGSDQVEVGAPPIKTRRGWLLIHSYIKDYLNPNSRTLGIEAILLDLTNPLKVVGRTQEPILIPSEDYEMNGKVPDVIFPSGALVQDGKLFVYYGAADTSCCLATCDLNELLEEMQIKAPTGVVKVNNPERKLRRFKGNPIISPIGEFAWEAKATFNPAAIYEDGKVHLIYRAMSNDNTSLFGYAASSDGFHIDERFTDPIYVPREKFEKKVVSGPGNSGCEDPRITKIGDILYMCYTAFDGSNPPRIALTSIKIDDFLKKRWNWKKPVLISPPGVDDKDACVFSEKVKDKYVMIHRAGVCVCINFVDTLTFGEDSWLTHQGSLIKPRPDKWDNRKIGLASPPIKTKDGWLLLYHGISDPGGIYMLGAALLRLDDPGQVIARTDSPLLEPEAKYEKEGQVPNVVFPGGAVVIEGKLFVYYGGADKVVGVAVADLDTILQVLRESK